MASKSERQQLQIDSERNMEVYKRNDMIQKARFTLSIQEQRVVLYAISKIQPEDTFLKEYEFDIKDFYALCGIEDQSYTRLKKMIKELSDKSWWVKKDDGQERLVRWFDVIGFNKGTGKVVVAFHRDMMPFLVQLVEQKTFYTSYSLRYVLPMSCQYSPRLYEILKSYSNNTEWFFDIDELKRLLDCQNYVNFNDFKRRALDPAVAEINKYTDIKIAYTTEKEGRRVSRVIFGIYPKTKKELDSAEFAGIDVLDGARKIDVSAEDPILNLKIAHVDALEREKHVDQIIEELKNTYFR